MSPGPDRQYYLSATSRDARFEPYLRPDSTLKVEQNDTLVLPPTPTMLLTHRNHPLGAVQMNATRSHLPTQLAVRPPKARASEFCRMETTHASMHPGLFVEVIQYVHLRPAQVYKLSRVV